MRTYNINDGLVSNQVRGFFQDKEGFIWIMTWEGVSRFDGHSFKNYTAPGQLAHPMVNAMIEGEDSELYIAENDGTIDVINNGEVDITHRIKHKTAINKLIHDSSGKIFAPSDETGISFFDKGKITTLNNSGRDISINDFVVYNDHFFVCGSFNGVLTREHEAIQSWPGQTGDYSCLLKDSTMLWVGTLNGLMWVDLSDHQYNLITTPFQQQIWSTWNIKNILKATDGSIYISAIGGVIRIMKDHSWRVYTRSDGLPSDYFNQCEKAKEITLMHEPDVVLMDIDMPGKSGIEGVALVKEARPETAVIMYTVFEDNEKLFQCLCAGANGYLLKKTPPQKLFDAIQEVIMGGAPMSPQIARKVLGSFHTKAHKVSYDLAPREAEVLQHLIKGYGTKQIAAELFISFDTVRSHLKNIYQKLHVNCGKEAIVKALRERIVHDL